MAEETETIGSVLKKEFIDADEATANKIILLSAASALLATLIMASYP